MLYSERLMSLQKSSPGSRRTVYVAEVGLNALWHLGRLAPFWSRALRLTESLYVCQVYSEEWQGSKHPRIPLWCVARDYR